MKADIDAFIDALWLEEGLSRNTLAAYRRDLTLYLRWLEPRGGKRVARQPLLEPEGVDEGV
ncbi:MAG: site-specific tyrosine recombinase XerD, partial [Comamonadaceae bacterium]